MISLTNHGATKRFRTWFKVTSVITAWAFFFLQIAWAQDLNPLGPAPVQQEDNRAGMLSPTELTDAQERAETLINIKNEIDSFQNSIPAGSTTQILDDLYIEHDGKSVYQISSPGSFTIDAIRFSEELDAIFSVPFDFNSGDNPAPQNSFIRLTTADGTTHLYDYSPSLSDALSQEKLVQTITSDNAMIAYSNGLVDTILKADGEISRYTYVFDEAEYLTDIIQSKYDATRVFDSDGNLERMYVATTDGYTEISYKDGAPHVLTKPNGTSYLYTYLEQDGETVTCITLLRYVNEDGSVCDFENGEPVSGAPELDRNTAVSIIHGPDGLIEEVRDSEGTTFFYDSGVIVRSVDATGKETFYGYEYGTEEQIIKTIIKSGAVTIEYDAQGNIDRAFIGEGDERIIVEFESGKIEKVTSNEHIIFYTYEEDPDTGEEIIRMESYSAHVKTKYDENGLLTELVFSDGTVVRYNYDESGLITESAVYRAGVVTGVYKYSYTDGRIIVEDQFRIKRIYDCDYNLIGMETPQGYYYLYSAGSDGSGKLIYVPDAADQYPPLNIEYRYNSGGELVATERSDGTTITFFEGKVANLLNEDGDVLVGYTYDADGNLLNARLVSLRQLLEEAENKANLDLADETLYTLDTLSGIAQMGNESITQDGDEFAGKSADLRVTLEDLRTQVQNGDDYPVIDGGVADLDEFDAGLSGELDAAKAEIDDYLAQKSAEVESEAGQKIDNVSTENMALLEQALGEEVVPFVAYYYDEYLGRSPTEEEIAPWKGKELAEIKEELIAFLVACDEYTEKIAQRDLIISELGTILEDYISGSAMEKLEILSRLGIDGVEVVDLDQMDAEAIVDNLGKLPIHFASSAIMSLKELMQGSGAGEVVYEELARDALLVDIFTGQGLNSSGENLALSAYALSKAALAQGVNLNAYVLDDLNNIAEPVVAFVDGNHYIVIKSVENGIVTYFEPSLSADGSFIQVEIKDFAWRYSGVVIAPNPPQGATILEDQRAMLIKGGKDDDDGGGGGGGGGGTTQPPPRLGAPLTEAIDQAEALPGDLDNTLTATVELTKAQIDDATLSFADRIASIMDDYRLITGVNFASLTDLSAAFLQMLPGLQVVSIPLITIDYLAHKYYARVEDSLADPTGNVLNIQSDLGRTLDTYLSCSRTSYDSDGRMKESISEDGVLTTYEYDESTGLILSSREYESGLLSHVYTYAFDGDLTIIEDETGSRKAYDDSMDLVYIENADGSKYDYSIKDGLPTLTLINEEDIRALSDEVYTKEYIYNMEGGINAVVRSDGTRLNYAGGLLRTVTDSAGRVLIEYSYNDSGELIDVRLVQAREDLERQAERLNAEILLKGDYSLERMAIKENLARINIKRTAESLKRGLLGQISELNQRIAYLESTRPQPYKVRFLWWTRTVHPDTSAWDRAIGDIRGYISQIQSAIPQVDIERQNALASLDEQVAFMRDEQIPGDIAEALINVENQRDAFLKDIEISEILPLVGFYYRNLLGRDANSDELEYWKEYRRGSQGVDDYEYIKSVLTGLPEYADKVALRESVAAYIRDYLTDNARAPPQEIDSVYSYLIDQSNHFASSAIGTLGQYLKLQGVELSYEDLLKEAILQDILSGALNQSNLTGDLVISLDTISTICRDNGVNVIPAKVGFTKLESIPAPFIAMINGDHFVIVKEFTDNTITYYDPNVGPDGEDVQVAADKFGKIFTGYILTSEDNVEPASVLERAEALSVKGGTFPFIGAAIIGILGGIAYAVGTVALAVTSVLTGIGAVLSTIAGAIGSIAGSISGFLGSTSLFSGLASFQTAFPGIGAFLMGEGFLGGALGTAIGGVPIIGQVLSSIVPWIANFGVGTLISEGLSALGVNSTIINMINGFVMGGPAGLVASGVSELGRNFGMDPALTNILACGAGALVGTGGNLSRVLPTVVGNLADYGICELGNHYGLDPRLSSILGSIGSGTVHGAFAEASNTGDYFWSIFNSVSSELISIALREAMMSLPRAPGVFESLFASLGAETVNHFLDGAGFTFSGSSDLEDSEYADAGEVLGLISSIEEGRITGDIWGAFQNGLSSKLFSDAVESLSDSVLSVAKKLMVDLDSSLKDGTAVTGESPAAETPDTTAAGATELQENPDSQGQEEDNTDSLYSGNLNINLSGGFQDPNAPDADYEDFGKDGLSLYQMFEALYNNNDPLSPDAKDDGIITNNGSLTEITPSLVDDHGKRSPNDTVFDIAGIGRSLTPGSIFSSVSGLMFASQEALSVGIDLGSDYGNALVDDDSSPFGLLKSIGNKIEEGLVEIKDIFKGILDQPNVKVAEGCGDVAGGLMEIKGGAALIAGGVVGEIPTASTSTALVIAGWGLIAKGAFSIKSGYDKINEGIYDAQQGSVDQQNNSTIEDFGESYSIVDGMYTGYDNFRNFPSLNSWGLGSAIISGMRLYVEIIEYFFE